MQENLILLLKNRSRVLCRSMQLWYLTQIHTFRCLRSKKEITHVPRNFKEITSVSNSHYACESARYESISLWFLSIPRLSNQRLTNPYVHKLQSSLPLQNSISADKPILYKPSSCIYTSTFIPVHLVLPWVNSVINIRRRLYSDNHECGHEYVYCVYKVPQQSRYNR